MLPVLRTGEAIIAGESLSLQQTLIHPPPPATVVLTAAVPKVTVKQTEDGYASYRCHSK